MRAFRNGQWVITTCTLEAQFIDKYTCGYIVAFLPINGAYVIDVNGERIVARPDQLEPMEDYFLRGNHDITCVERILVNLCWLLYSLGTWVLPVRRRK
jgi:hypothetical protein